MFIFKILKKKYIDEKFCAKNFLLMITITFRGIAIINIAISVIRNFKTTAGVIQGSSPPFQNCITHFFDFKK